VAGAVSSYWDSRYQTGDYVFGTTPSEWLVAHRADLKPGMRALALADGEGRNGVWLASQGVLVTCVDQSETAQAKARELAAGRRVTLELVNADLLVWDWPSGFDLVLICFLHLPPDARRKVFQQAITALAPGGLLLVEGYHADGNAKAPPENRFTEQNLRELLKELTIEAVEERTDASDMQGNPRHVVRVAARRDAGGR